MGPLAEIKRTSSFHPTPHFFDGHRRPRLYRTYILNQLISLFKYPFELSAKPNLGGTGGHFDPPIVQTSRFFLSARTVAVTGWSKTSSTFAAGCSSIARKRSGS